MLNRRLAKSILLLVLSFLIVANPLLFDLSGGGINNFAANARELTEIKLELDASHSKYMDAVKSGQENISALFNDYSNLLKEYNTEKKAEESKTVATPPTTEESTGFFGKLKSLASKFLKAPWSSDGKSMSLLEKVLWGVGKAIIPTIAVIAFASMVTLPIGWMAIAAMGIGGLTGGALKYFNEKRLNTFRSEKKNGAEIFRDVLVSGVTEAVMAPFNLVSMALAGKVVRLASKKVIMEYALKSGASYFAGRMISSSIAGGIKWHYYRNVFKDNIKVENMQKETDRILARHDKDGTPISDEEMQILLALDTEINKIQANDYSINEFVKDAKTAAVGAAISGVGGMYLSKMSANSPWAAKLSMKIFKDTKHSGMVSHWIMSNPTAFASGAANAQLNKSFINDDISLIEAKRDKFSKDSPVYNYYNSKIKAYETKRDSISLVKEGLKTAGTNFAIQSGMVAVSALKTRIVDIPRAEKAEIHKRFLDQSNEGKTLKEAQSKYDDLLKKKPQWRDINKYKSKGDFIKARRDYMSDLRAAKANVQKAEILAENSFKNAKSTDLYKNIKTQVKTDNNIARRLELAKYMGDKQTLEAYKYKMKHTAGNEGKTDIQIEKMAKDAIKADYKARADKLSSDLEDFAKKYSKYREIHDSAASEKSAFAKLGWRKLARNNNNLTKDELIAIEYQAKSMPPSKFKAMIVDQQISQLKATGATDAMVKSQMTSIYDSADQTILNYYGNSWKNILTAEVIAGTTRKIPYDSDGDVDLFEQISQIISKDIPTKIEQGIVSDYKNKINGEIKDLLLPHLKVNDDSLKGETLNKFLETFVDKGTKEITNETVDGSIKRIKESSGISVGQ